MTQLSPQPSVDVLDAHELRLVEAPPPQLSPEHRAARDRAWNKAVQANPSLFDGQVVACTQLDRSGPDELVLHWTRLAYRNYALRWVPGAPALSSLFVDVLQPTHEGALLAGRMSSSTVVPGRWQLPGGSVEPPDGGAPLDEAALRHNAARELLEETGIDTAPDDLTLWAVTRGTNGNIGVHYMAPPQPAPVLNERFTAVVSAAAAVGQSPELDQIALVHSPADLKALEGPHVDYLMPVVDRYARILL